MTVSSEQSQVPYFGDGVSTFFTVPFYFLQASDIKVQVTNLLGVSTDMVINIDYTVAGAGNQLGGGVTFAVAPANLFSILIYRLVPATQLMDYQPNDDFPAESHERALDKLTMLVQQSLSADERALIRPIGKNYYDAENRIISNVANPIAPQDAATKTSVEAYVASILATGQGPINNAANVVYVYPDLIARNVQSLATKNDPLLGSAGIGHNNGTVKTALDSLDSSTLAFTDAQGTPQKHSAVSQFVGMRNFGSVIIIGDSIAAGNGQGNGYFGGMGGRFSRSLMNSFDRGLGRDRGFMYETLLDTAQYFTVGNGFNGVGSFEAGGAANARFRMNAGGYTYVNGREISQATYWWDVASSTAGSTWQVTVDGEAAASGTIASSDTTGAINLMGGGGGYIRADSEVRFTTLTGSILLQGFQGVRNGTANAPLVWVAPEGSQGFSDFAAAARVAAISTEINLAGAAAPKLIVVLLGTNNMSAQVGKQLTPANYIIQLDNMINTYKASLGGDTLCRFAIWVPPKPNEVLPLGTYAEYVKAIVDYCKLDPRMSCIRTDLTPLGQSAAFLTDTLHPNNEGHCILAQTLCDHFSIPMDTYYPITAIPFGDTYGRGAKPPTMQGTWVNSTSIVVDTLLDGGNRKSGHFAGTVTKAAGSGTANIFQVRANVAPTDPRPVFAMDVTGAQFKAFLMPSGMLTLQHTVAEINGITTLYLDSRYTI